ncbi:MAG: hypothetical protein ACK5QT_11275 [Oligoflexia bacterium]
MKGLKQTTDLKSLLSLMLAVLLVLEPLTPLAWAKPDPCQNEEAWSRQKSNYCSAAKVAEEAQKGQFSVGFIQAAVAATCLEACLTVVSNLTPNWCTYASVAGTAATMMTTKNTTAKLSSAAGTGLMVFKPGMEAQGQIAREGVAEGAYRGAYDATNQSQYGTQTADAMFRNPSKLLNKNIRSNGSPTLESESTNAAGNAKEKALNSPEANEAANKAKTNAARTLACATAAFSALSSYMSFDGAKDSKKKAEENRKLAAELDTIAANTPAPEQATGSNTGGANPGTNPANPAPPQGPGFGIANAPSGAGGPGAQEQRKRLAPGALPSFGPTLSAALAFQDNGLPPGVSSPQFRATLEKLSGRSADDLAKIAMQSQDPAVIMKAGLARTLNSKGMSFLDQILAESKVSLQRELATMAPSKLASSTSSPSSPLFTSTIEQISVQAQPELNPSDRAPAANEPAHGILSSVLGDEENRELSLFSRVSTRYQVSQDRVSAVQQQ